MVVPRLARSSRTALFFAVLILACLDARASGLGIDPVRLVLSSSQATGSFDLRNSSDSDIVLQVLPNTWTQDADHGDTLKPTDALLALPPVIRIPPGGHQVLRVAVPAPPATGERAFRLLIREIPPPSAPGFIGVRTLVQLSIPVFVHADDVPAAKASDLRCSPATEGGLRIDNNAMQHVHLQHVTVDAATSPHVEVKTSLNVLAGGTVVIDLPATIHLSAGMPVQVVTSDGVLACDLVGH